MFQCMECGKLYGTHRAAERATLDGCPKCGSTDVDLAPYGAANNRRALRKKLSEILDMEPVCSICGKRHDEDDCPSRGIPELEAIANELTRYL